MLHIWHEDSLNSSTTQFWLFLKEYGYIPVNTDIIGHESNNKLLKYVKAQQFNSNDTYIILMDAVNDNSDIKVKYTNLLRYTKQYSNVHVSRLLCFEYLMLRFDSFDVWIKSNNKNIEPLLQVRKALIDVIDRGYAWHNNDTIVDYVRSKYCITDDKEYKKRFFRITTEEICFELITDITNRAGRAFLINKTVLGECWINYCCAFCNGNIREARKFCYIARYKKDTKTKAGNLWNGTLAKQIVERKY